MVGESRFIKIKRENDFLRD